MKKLLERLRFWLIHKLGGFTEQYHRTTRIVQGNTVPYQILQVSTFVENEVRMELPRKRVLEYARAQLAIRLADELMRSDAVIVESREDRFRDVLELRARVFVLEGKGSALYLNRPLWGGGTVIPFPDKKYQIIYADPPWAYRQGGRGAAKNHYQTMTTEELCNLPVGKITGGGACLFLWATLPAISDAIKVMEAWGFRYKTAAFVWVKTYAKSGRLFWGMGQYTRANAEVCLLGVSKEFRASKRVKSHRVHQVVEAPFAGHSRKPPEVRERIVELLGDVPRIELFARERAEGWDAWGDEV